MRWIWVLLSVLPIVATAHPRHTTMTDIQYRPATKTLEVAIKVAAQDLEEALSKTLGRSVRLDTDPQQDQYVQNYAIRVIRFWGAKGVQIPLRWIGYETEGAAAWLYFEVTLKDGLSGVQMQNALFFDIAAEQVNTVLIATPTGKRTLIFVQGEDKKRPVFSRK